MERDGQFCGGPRGPLPHQEVAPFPSPGWQQWRPALAGLAALSAGPFEQLASPLPSAAISGHRPACPAGVHQPIGSRNTDAEPNVIQQVVQHTITFSTSSLIEAITEAFIELSHKSMDGAVERVLPAMDSSLVFLTEVDKRVWRNSRTSRQRSDRPGAPCSRSPLSFCRLSWL